MELHEYQAKNLLRKKGVKSPFFFTASSYEEAETKINHHHIESAVVKVQVHAGGRGKAGGILIGRSKEELLKITKKLLNLRITNKQTGPQGLVAHTLLFSEIFAIKKEYYLSALVDRDEGSSILLVKKEGGVEVESESPSSLLKEKIVKGKPLSENTLEKIARFLSWKEEEKKQGYPLLQGLVEAFFNYDATLIEINPLAKDAQGNLSSVDMKMTVDGDALFRNEELIPLEDTEDLTPTEQKAKAKGLAFVGLKGSVGCMVNGAGMAMATIDLLKEHNIDAANFLDVGGLSAGDKIVSGIEILLQESSLKAIFINIFSGISDCIAIATIIKEVLDSKKNHPPIVIRLCGNKEKEGREVLKSCNITLVDSLEEGAERIGEYVNTTQ